MPRLPRVSGEQTVRALEQLGFRRARQSGSHVVLRKSLPDGDVGCVVPMHRELAVGTLLGILKQARISRDEFAAQL
jgi:predicted RNA binding protein YcfA (HicA-like mRNA interferase family)